MESRRKINHKRTCERIGKSGTSEKEDRRRKANGARTCQENREGLGVKKNGRFTSSRKKTESMTENQVERLFQIGHGKCWVKG